MSIKNYITDKLNGIIQMTSIIFNYCQDLEKVLLHEGISVILIPQGTSDFSLSYVEGIVNEIGPGWIRVYVNYPNFNNTFNVDLSSHFFNKQNGIICITHISRINRWNTGTRPYLQVCF
jgi:hypothetical protein